MKDLIKTFFEEHVLPLHQATNRQEEVFLETSLDKSAESYFAPLKHPAYQHLSNIAFTSPEKLEEYLKLFWKDQPSLLAMVPDLVVLAFRLKEQNKEQTAELSPFVYTMF
ncbi:MAG: hypothetical protein WKF70_08670 [Chitinophagaceae bacterium]